jgi:hypothetical protein
VSWSIFFGVVGGVLYLAVAVCASANTGYYFAYKATMRKRMMLFVMSILWPLWIVVLLMAPLWFTRDDS